MAEVEVFQDLRNLSALSLHALDSTPVWRPNTKDDQLLPSVTHYCFPLLLLSLDPDLADVAFVSAISSASATRTSTLEPFMA